jgi:hypothetical protein
VRTLSFSDTIAALTKQAAADQIPGGVADNMSAEDVNPDELRMGRKHEREHTHNDQVAEEIALDHLAEDPHYYTNLKEKVKAAASKKDPDPPPSALEAELPIKYKDLGTLRRIVQGLGGAAAPDVGTELANAALHATHKDTGKGHLGTRLLTRQIARQMGEKNFFGPDMTTFADGAAYAPLDDELHIPVGSAPATIAHEVGHQRLHRLLGRPFTYASGVSRLASNLAPLMGAWAGGSEHPTLVPGYIHAALTAPMLFDEAAASAQAIYNQARHRGLEGLADSIHLIPAFGTYASQALMPLAIGKARQAVETVHDAEEPEKLSTALRIEPRNQPGYSVGKGDSMASSGPAAGQKTAALLAVLRKVAADMEMPMEGAASTRFLHNPESGVAPEGGMVLGKLHRISEMAQMLMGILEANDQLPPWVQDHVSVAYENLDQVFGYLEPKSHMGSEA